MSQKHDMKHLTKYKFCAYLQNRDKYGKINYRKSKEKNMIKTFDFGCLSSNTYVVSDGGEAMIIDAGVECAPIAEYIRSNSLAVKYIVLTHGHYDHMCYIRD